MNVFVGITFGFLDMKASFSTDFEKITALGELKNTCFCNTNGDGDGNDDNDERTMVMNDINLFLKGYCNDCGED